MRSLIDELIDAPTDRKVGGSLQTRSRRPLPTRPREVFEVFGALGPTATFGGFARSVLLRGAQPNLMANLLLGRWLSPDELARIGSPYQPLIHIRETIVSREFRTTIAGRAFEAFPERRRMFHIAVPGCATRFTGALWDSFYPVLRSDILDPRYDDRDQISALLGKLFQRLMNGKTVCAVVPHLSHITEPPGVPPAETGFIWTLHGAPLRAHDMAFTVMRSPESHALALANGTVARLRQAADAGQEARLAGLPPGPLPDPADEPGWKALALRLLRENLPVNPICAALGDGSCEGALAACARVPLTFAALEQYTEWVDTTFDMHLIDPVPAAEKLIRPRDLGAAEHAAIAARLGQDQAFYARFAAARARLGLPSVPGTALLD